MPTTVTSITGGSGVGNDSKNVLKTTFFTTNATPQVFQFIPTDPLPGAIAQCYHVHVRWAAVGPSSISAGQAIAAFYDNGTITLSAGSATLMASGSATLSIGVTGGRASQFMFTGLSATNLAWTVVFEITPMAAE
jgi:hypothetical protein